MYGTIGKSQGEWVLPESVESYYWKTWWLKESIE